MGLPLLKKVKPESLAREEYGCFSENGKEFTILRPDTPRPWFNYLSNDIYHAIISHTGGGYSYNKDCKLHRILQYEDHRSDRPGRYLYIKDRQSKKIWSPTWQPLCEPLSSWQATHGFGYTHISATHDDIETNITYFVPRADPCEVWLVKIKNTSTEERRLSLYPYVSFLLGDFYIEQDYKNILLLYNEGYFDKKTNSIVAFKHPTSSRPYETYGFFSSSSAPEGYEIDAEKFLGNYGYLNKPATVVEGTTSNTSVRGKEMVGVFKLGVVLAPGEEKELSLTLGFVEDKKEVPILSKKYHDLTLAHQELEEVKKYWDQELSSIKIKTPDHEFDVMNNFWGKFQLLQCTRWRSAAPYNPGEGGRGFRDTAQDAEAATSLNPELSKRFILKLLANQYETGHAVAGFSDIEGPWEIGSNTGVLGKGDVAVWIPYMVTAYLKETGDFQFIHEKIPFLNGKKSTVWEHLVAAMEHFQKAVGPHGLPLFWKADWNDAFDRCGIKGKGESVWLALAYVRALKQMEELSIFLKRNQWAKKFRKWGKHMSDLVLKKAWDGEWFISLFTDEGKVVGSHKNEEGKIYLNPQSWAILSGVAGDLHQKKLLASVEKFLETDFGPALFAPQYTKYDPKIGRITAFAPGTKENAAIFSHACAFMIVAYAQAHLGEKAFELFKKITPLNGAKKTNIYKAEPYVYAEYCHGLGNQEFGEGAFTWNTGTAAWMFMAAHQWILGVRPTYEGLLIDPVIPKGWREFYIEREFRGSLYKIKVSNPNGVEHGVKEVRVNGKKIKDNLILPSQAHQTYDVEVVMG